MPPHRDVKVLATRRFPGGYLDEFDTSYLTERLTAGSAPCPDTEVLVVSGERIDAAILGLFPRLELICKYGVGHDSIDLAECDRRGVAVALTRGALEETTADLAFGLLLALRRRLTEASNFVRAGRWPQEDRSFLTGTDVHGSSLGIIGLGAIGRRVARRALGFSMRVYYADPQPLPAAEEAALGVSYLPLEELLAVSDVVSLHCPLTRETRGIIERASLARLRDGASLINTARGELIDDDALLAELASGRISAALDVHTHEPHARAELLDLPNVILTPHIGSLTDGARIAMTRVLAENIRALAHGEPLPTAIAVSSTAAVAKEH